MMSFMKNEELYGAVDMPVWVERTAVGSSVQALLQCMPQLRIEGSIVGRLMTRMAEVLEGRHTDEEIADTSVQQLRDFTTEGEEQKKRRIAQHSLFVQVDGEPLTLTPTLALALTPPLTPSPCRSMDRASYCVT